MSTDTTVQVMINYVPLVLGDIGQAAIRTYDQVKNNIIKAYYQDLEDYNLNDAGDEWNEELRFLRYVIHQGFQGSDSGILTWGMTHKNLISSEFIEHLAPFWKEVIRSHPGHIVFPPNNIIVLCSDSDKDMEVYYIGMLDTGTEYSADELVYKRIDKTLNWAHYNVELQDGKRF